MINSTVEGLAATASFTLIRLVGIKFLQRQAGLEANPKSRLGAPGADAASTDELARLT